MPHNSESALRRFEKGTVKESPRKAPRPIPPAPPTEIQRISGFESTAPEPEPTLVEPKQGFEPTILKRIK